MSRVMAFIASLCVAVFAVLPGRASAWDSNSFVGDAVEFYSYEPVMSLSSAGASVLADSSGSVSSLDFQTMFSSLLTDRPSMYVGVRVYHPADVVGGISLPAWEETRYYPEDGIPYNCSYVPLNYYYLGIRSFSVPDELNGGECRTVSGPLFNVEEYSTPGLGSPWAYGPISVDVPLSSLGSFSAFSLHGALTLASYLFPSNGSVSRILSGHVDLLVNGAFVHSFYSDSNGNIDFSDYIYSASFPISSVGFDIYPDFQSFPYSSSVYDLILQVESIDYPLTMSVLVGDSVLDGFNDEGQDAINQEDALQSQWGGSMVDNFNALNVSSFSYPDGLQSAFSLVSGIFQDIWSAFGDYAILWVFPLTLAIILLVVGRISKTAGRGKKAEGGGE